jgi:hypothetical protein
MLLLKKTVTFYSAPEGGLPPETEKFSFTFYLYSEAQGKDIHGDSRMTKSRCEGKKIIDDLFLLIDSVGPRPPTT